MPASAEFFEKSHQPLFGRTAAVVRDDSLQLPSAAAARCPAIDRSQMQSFAVSGQPREIRHCGQGNELVLHMHIFAGSRIAFSGSEFVSAPLNAQSLGRAQAHAASARESAQISRSGQTPKGRP